MMKWKVSTIVFASLWCITLVIAGVGCNNENSTVSASDVVEFDMKELSDDWLDDFYLYEDKETHIQYILYKDNSNAALCPRYYGINGALYSDAIKE